MFRASSCGRYERYLRNATKMRRLRAAAIPDIGTVRVPIELIAISRKTVGVRGFEPPTAGTQSRPSTRLRYTPE
jgi:hypothetical protein